VTFPDDELRDLVRRHGRLTFARFMETALFSPRGGYYTRCDRIGGSGDYFTSPHIHPLFGALLALQLEDCWELLGRPETFTVVEPGAGNGILARDIISYSQALSSGFSQAIRYVVLDGCHFPQDQLAHRVVARGVPLRGIVGCLLSNELLDAFPVHRFRVKQGRLLEVYLMLRGDRWVEVLDEPSTPVIAARIDQLQSPLPEGFCGEVSVALEKWVEEVATAVHRGFVFTLDYGWLAHELYSVQRSHGTLRCYYQHTVNANPYVRIGRQDITSHVDFSHLMESGERHGLCTLGYETQREFLLNLGHDVFKEAVSILGGLSRFEVRANLRAMEELVRPGEGLGGFKVLAQGKGVGRPPLHGFPSANLRRKRLSEYLRKLPVPLRRREHIPILEGDYPHVAQESILESSWSWGEEEK
jgi:SAM-dependent MidA family methyltransferase